MKIELISNHICYEQSAKELELSSVKILLRQSDNVTF